MLKKQSEQSVPQMPSIYIKETSNIFPLKQKQFKRERMMSNVVDYNSLKLSLGEIKQNADGKAIHQKSPSNLSSICSTNLQLYKSNKGIKQK
mmetsp:Transcript_15145/g.13289  ORF Transcript_15145/g.13289 Transcript_15145/m.13289 type:complete len:92 (+) Transcript_15145:225-500(+)